MKKLALLILTLLLVSGLISSAIAKEEIGSPVLIVYEDHHSVALYPEDYETISTDTLTFTFTAFLEYIGWPRLWLDTSMVLVVLSDWPGYPA